uniref:Uncharacterized protein n=1 Tax=Ciona intestinalis TaxID=7719 RepID=H2XMX8_CIOIN
MFQNSEKKTVKILHIDKLFKEMCGSLPIFWLQQWCFE